VNPTGDDVTMSTQPLSGQALWPGIVVDSDGIVIDWPGWRLEDGVWVAGDEFDWALADLDVEFRAGPMTTRLVSYPAATDTCIPTPEGGVAAGGSTPAPSASASSDAPVGSAAPTQVAPPETSTVAPTRAPAGAPIALLLLMASGVLTAAAVVARAPARRRDRAR
jgi:hypothetical protein